MFLLGCCLLLLLFFCLFHDNVFCLFVFVFGVGGLVVVAVVVVPVVGDVAINVMLS